VPQKIGTIDFHFDPCFSCAQASEDGECYASDLEWASKLTVDIYAETIICGCYVEKED